MSVSTINHFELNRPVHLARRDLYFEKAVDLIFDKYAQHGLGPDLNPSDYEEILFFLSIARDHAGYAIRKTEKSEKDVQFSRFINLLVGNVKAVLSMIDLKGMIEDSSGSSFGFLGVNEASAGLQAEEYQRRANDFVRSIRNTLNLALDPFEELKAENRDTSTKEENMRYAKARNHFSELVKEEHLSKTSHRIRTFVRFWDRSKSRNAKVVIAG